MMIDYTTPGCELKEGMVITIGEYDQTKFVIKYGWYTYKNQQYLGWYAESILENMIIPTNQIDWMTVTVINDGCDCGPCPCPPPHPHDRIIPFTESYKMLLDRTFIVVDTYEDFLHLKTSYIPDGKIVKINNVGGLTKFFTWNEETHTWNPIYQVGYAKSEAEMLSYDVTTLNQLVYREDTESLWMCLFLPTGISWMEISSKGTAWIQNDKPVNFNVITWAEFKDMERDEDTLYFISDKNKIYKGSQNYTNSVVLIDTEQDIPDIKDAVQNVLYIDNETCSMRFTSDNVKWVVCNPGYLTDGANWVQADSNKFATIGLIKKGIEETLQGIITRLGEGPEDAIVLSTSDGNIKRSDAFIGGQTLEGDSNKLALESAVVDAISWKSI